jgi:transposase
MSERRRRVFPETFKREAIERAALSGLPIARIAQELGLNETVLRRWIAKHAAEGTASPRRPTTQAAAPSLADLAAENARLKRELQRAEMERDILKKAALIFGAASR